MNVYRPISRAPRVILALERFDGRIRQGVERFAWENGWHLEGPCSYTEQLSSLQDWDGDGIIAQPESLSPTARLTRFIKCSRRPAVSLQPMGLFLGSARVQVDYHSVGRVGASHLGNGGYRSLWFVRFTHDEVEDALWDGFSGWALEKGLEARSIDFAALCRGNLRRDRSLGLMAPSDRKASSVVATCLRQGLDVPEEVGVVGVGNDENVCALAPVALSSVDTDLESVGYESARSLDSLMKGKRPEVETRQIPSTRVIARQSAWDSQGPCVSSCYDTVRQGSVHTNALALDTMECSASSLRTVRRS